MSNYWSLIIYFLLFLTQKTISDLKSSSELLETDKIFAKVVQKTKLWSYQTQDKVKRFWFQMAVADHTASIKLKAYGKDYHKMIKENKSYLFRKLKKDELGEVMVTSKSIVSDTRAVEVPVEIQEEAQRRLNYSLLCSIAEAKLCHDGTVSVQGTISEVILSQGTHMSTLC